MYTKEKSDLERPENNDSNCDSAMMVGLVNDETDDLIDLNSVYDEQLI